MKRQARATSPDHGRGRERGAAIVEFALVAPFLALIELGFMEYGTIYKADDQAQQALMSAGRVAGQGSNGPLADFQALRALDSSLSGLKRATIKKVIIYKAPSDGKPPANCLAETPTGTAAGVPSVCNVYSPSQVASTDFGKFSYTGSTCNSLAWDSNWCPFQRNPQSEQVGVYVELTYQPFTGVVPKIFTISRYTVYDVEPTQIRIGG